MAYDRFSIAPLVTGLQTDLRPFLIPDDAFFSLRNVYVFRGRVRKRFGARLMGPTNSIANQQMNSRLRVQVGTIGSPSSPVPGDIFLPGQMFTAGSQFFTVYQTGTPAAMLATGPGTGTYDTTTGDFVLTGTGLGNSTPIYWYPSQPVMGLTQYQVGSLNNQPSYAFDTQFAYVFANGAWGLSTDSPTWQGDNTNFFWATNWTGITDDIMDLFVTNFQVANPEGAGEVTDDPMYYFDGSTWTNFSLVTQFLTAGNFVQSARIIIPFKDRLLLLNTIENDASGGYGNNTSYVNRCRYSHNGSPLSSNAWLEDNQEISSVYGDGAGYLDATTDEAIVGAEFIKDRLIVFFEKSTWELAYTGNEILPFRWQKINTELGSESTFSSVPFDKVILTVGQTGIHACNGANVFRADEKIPDQVFNIIDKTTGVERIQGIRDYYTEMVYWTFPSTTENPNNVYPNQILAYNYATQSWSFFDDTITCFGYFDQQPTGTWQSLDTWEEADYQWDSGTEISNFRQIIAGNQQGWTFLVLPDLSFNSPSLQISNIVIAVGGQSATLTVYNHNLQEYDVNRGDYFYILDAAGTDGIALNIYYANPTDANTLVIYAPEGTTFSGSYTGAGIIVRVSNIEIVSKQWNPYGDKSRNVFLAKIDFAVGKTSQGQVTVDYYPSDSQLSMITEAQNNNCSLGNNVLETSPYALVPFEAVQNRLWHTVYFQTDGECIQIKIYMSPDQITNPSIAESDFELEGMILYTQPTSDRLQ